MLNMKYDVSGLHLTEQFEGLRLEAYQDVRGIWTIGYGHTGNVLPGQKIDRELAETLLAGDTLHAALTVDRLVTHDIDQHQFDALTDFTYNEGEGSFAKSTLLDLVNKGDLVGAAAEFAKWDQSGGRVFDGLVRRRTAERAMFLAPEPVAA